MSGKQLKLQQSFFVKYSFKFKLTAMLLAMILVFIIMPSEFWAWGDEDDVYLVESYDDEQVSHTAGVGYEEKEESYILGEQADCRTETSKQFLLSDGSLMVQEYGFPVHYNDGNEYCEVDNRLVQTSASKKSAGYFSNTAGYFDVKIADTLKGENNHLSVTKDGYTISMGLKTNKDFVLKESAAVVEDGLISKFEAKESKESAIDYSTKKSVQSIESFKSEKLESELVYKEVFSGTDFEYNVNPMGVKENIIVRSQQKSYNYDFNLSADGLGIIERGKRNLFFINNDGKVIFNMPSMFMTDAEGAYSEEVFYTLTKNNDGYTLTVTADASWINDKERKFPVVIDPIINTWTESLAAGWTLNKDGTRSANSDGRVDVSTNSYALIRFPVNATINGKYNIKTDPFRNKTLSYGTVNLHVKSEGSAWDGLEYEVFAAESLKKFDDIRSINDLRVEETIIHREKARSLKPREHSDSFSFSADSIKNDEVIFIYKNKQGDNSSIKGRISVSDWNNLPTLTLYYKNIQGISEYPTEKFEINDATAHVNMVSRRLAVAVGGISINTDAMPLQVDLIYNQNFNETLEALGVPKYFGAHFKSNFNQYVRKVPNTNDYYHIGADGTINLYKKGNGQHYTSEKTQKTLVSSSVSATLFDAEGNRMDFSYGRLKRIYSDSNIFLGKIEISYVQSKEMDTDKIDKVVYYRFNSNGRSSNEIKYNYDSNRLTSLVSYYRDTDGLMKVFGKKIFEYDVDELGEYNLVRIKNKLAQTRVQLDFNNGVLSNIRDNTGLGYEFSQSGEIVTNVTRTQGTSSGNLIEYDNVGFFKEKNTLSARYYSNGLPAGSRSVATDVQRRVISEWYTDVDGNTTISTDSLWRNSGNDAYFPNYSKSIYTYEEKLNTNFSDAFWLDANTTEASIINTAVPYKAGNVYALSFRLVASRGANITVKVGSQSKDIRAFDELDSYVTLVFSHASTGSEIKLINNGLDVRICNVSFCAVTNMNLYKNIEGSAHAYRIYKDEVIGLEKTTYTTYKNYNGVERIIEKDNTSNLITKTTKYSYEKDSVSQIGRLSKIVEHDGACTADSTCTKKETATTTITKEQSTNSDNTITVTETTTTIKNGKRLIYRVSSTAKDSEYRKVIRDTNGVVTTYRYSFVKDPNSVSDGNAIEVVKRGDEEYTYEYNVDGNLIKITDVNGKVQQLNYTNGSFSGVSYQSFNSYQINYNEYKLVDNIKANNTKVIDYDYFEDGYLDKIKYANGQSLKQSYVDKILDKTTYYDSATDTSPDIIDYSTDEFGRVTDVAVLDGTSAKLSYAYSGIDSRTTKTLSVTGANNYAGSYTYNIDEEMQRLTSELHSIAGNSYDVVYGYDDDGRVNSIVMGKYKLLLNYDEFGRIKTEQTVYNSKIDISYYTYQYEDDTSSFLRTKIEAKSSACFAQFNNPSADYDSQGRVKSISNNDSSSSVYTYTYDELGRLKTEKKSYSTVITYTYDENGNLDNVIGKNTMVYTYGTDGRLEMISGKGNYRFSYDGMGNPTTYKSQTLNWTRGRYLSSGTQKGNNFTYKYNAENLRYEKVVNGIRTQYYYSGGQIVGEKRGVDKIYYIYGVDGIAGMVYNGSYYFYEKNILGDVISVFDSNRVKVASYEYDAWGNVTDKWGWIASLNPIRYRGYYQDNETGFYYLNTRFYDPEIRRFINADNYELLPTLAGTYGQINMYNYCNNNPVMFTDPTGESITAVIVGIIIGAGIGALNGYFSGATTAAQWAINIGVGAFLGALGGYGISALKMGVISGMSNAFVDAYMQHSQNGGVNLAQSITTGVISGLFAGAFQGLGNGISKGILRETLGTRIFVDILMGGYLGGLYNLATTMTTYGFSTLFNPNTSKSSSNNSSVIYSIPMGGRFNIEDFYIVRL